MLCSFWLSTMFLFMVIVAKLVIQMVDSVGVLLSTLGLHNYNRLLALHLQKSTGSSSFIFITKCPQIQSQSTYFIKFSGGGHAPMQTLLYSISMLRMLIVVLCTINLTSNFTLYKGPHLYFMPQAP